MIPIEIDYNRDLNDLSELLASVTRPGSFYMSGSIETPMPRLEIEGVGTVAFPVLDHQAKEIVKQAERAPYGRGEATLVDPRVRKVWQIAPSKIDLGGKVWRRTSLSTTGSIRTTGGSISASFLSLTENCSPPAPWTGRSRTASA